MYLEAQNRCIFSSILFWRWGQKGNASLPSADDRCMRASPALRSGLCCASLRMSCTIFLTSSYPITPPIALVEDAESTTRELINVFSAVPLLQDISSVVQHFSRLNTGWLLVLQRNQKILLAQMHFEATALQLWSAS